MRFEVTNYKGIDRVSIEASEGDLVLIAGRNGAGKSSFIDGITELFDARGIRVTPKPIRDGESKAIAEFRSDELDVVIRRTWTKDDGGTLTIHSTDGARYQSPSRLLAELTGGLVFDPGRFLGLGEREQRAELLEQVDLPIDLDALAREESGAVERRRDAGREVKRLRGALDSMPKPPAGAPVEEVSASAVVAELDAATRLHEEARAREDVHRRLGDDIESRRATIERMQAELADLESERAALGFEIASAPALPDVDAIRDRLDSVEETNAQARAARERNSVAEELAAAESAQSDENELLADIERRKRDALAAADWPDEGLGITEDGVTLDGVPFRQANTARQIIAAMRIATAGDSRLRLVIVSSGDLLDADSLAAVQGIAAERGFTVLMERDRDESRSVGVEIREGRRVE